MQRLTVLGAVSLYPVTSDSTPQFHISPFPLSRQPPHVPNPPHQDLSLDLVIHCHRFKKTFIVAVHLTLANDLRVFLSWTPMKMSTTYRHASFFRIC